MCPRRNGMVKGTVIAFALVALPKREQDVAFDLVRGHMTLVVVMHRHGLPWVYPCQASAYHPEFNPWGTTVFLECATHCASKAEADAGGKGQEAVVGAGKVAGGVGSDSEMLQPVLHNSCEMPALHNEVI